MTKKSHPHPDLGGEGGMKECLVTGKLVSAQLRNGDKPPLLPQIHPSFQFFFILGKTLFSVDLYIDIY